MSTIKVANVHFESTGSNRIDYLNDNKIRISAANSTVISGSSTPLEVQGNVNISGTVSMGYSFMRNKIINGDMRIDQRNSGASISTASGTSRYTVDRWVSENSQLSKMTLQLNLNGITPPAGFANYLGVTSLSAYTLLSTDYFDIGQRIEGINIADLGWGAAGAQPVTLSFWVRSSLTGPWGGEIVNGTGTRCYLFSYTINQANTWEYKTITIPGDTTGTWATGTSTGLSVYFTLGIGSTYLGTANVWSGASVIAPTGSTSLVSTNGATWYITGVQLEAGTVATPFERRFYTHELSLCQRYFWYVSRYNVVAGPYASNRLILPTLSFEMRAVPAITTAGGVNLLNAGTAQSTPNWTVTTAQGAAYTSNTTYTTTLDAYSIYGTSYAAEL